ncbi:MAG: response regulator [Parvularcula sp.]|nr:response regulator [Parvularcula sp.]
MLIIEDNAFIALDLEAQLQDLGCEVVGTAVTASQAIEIARRTLPDLALVDLQLADGSRGQDAAQVLRSELNVTSIILSGSLHAVTEEERLNIRPIAMLSKPVLPHELGGVVSGYQDRRH